MTYYNKRNDKVKHIVIKFYTNIENEIIGERELGIIDIGDFDLKHEIFDELQKNVADDLFIRNADIDSIKIDWINDCTAYVYDCGELIGCIEKQG